MFQRSPSQSHCNRTSLYGEDRTLALIWQKQKCRHGDDGHKYGHRIPNWDRPKNKAYGKPIDAKEGSVIVAEDAIGDTSGAAPIVNGHLSNNAKNQRIDCSEEQNRYECT